MKHDKCACITRMWSSFVLIFNLTVIYCRIESVIQKPLNYSRVSPASIEVRGSKLARLENNVTSCAKMQPFAQMALINVS